MKYEYNLLVFVRFEISLLQKFKFLISLLSLRIIPTKNMFCLIQSSPHYNDYQMACNRNNNDNNNDNTHVNAFEDDVIPRTQLRNRCVTLIVI